MIKRFNTEIKHLLIITATTLVLSACSSNSLTPSTTGNNNTDTDIPDLTPPNDGSLPSLTIIEPSGNLTSNLSVLLA